MSRLTPVTAPLNIYDVYSISRDQRDISTIANDKYIQSKIASKILFTSGLSSNDIEIECFYGEVYIIGLVKNEAMHKKLIEIAKNTSGVKKVYQYISIKKNYYPCDNIKILLNLKQNLFSDSIIEGTNVRVSVVGCDVVFSGVIESIEQEKHALWYAKHIDGVESVFSFMRMVDKSYKEKDGMTE
ncbi:BON domain-containing protein [Campylobacter sp. faydin G-24]|uniref:BON domain-containing protein n=1 Tax=Campylobacter anatolicus TaxID=2829105 RepID=A0ABS5HGA8_9BACT|nr:BON domain-containing protein [Campylobacter anatolicus]MBR8463278.1 BON domain-containing protein [Campylobacter anatolicus]